jgi:hypothetical protein
VKSFDRLYQKQGAIGLKKTEVDGVWDVDLSREIDAEKAKDISNEIAREFMPMEHYYELKRFSYFDPDYTWDLFSEDVKNTHLQERPFG